MGFPAHHVGKMSLWQFMAQWDGFLQANGVEEKPEPMSLDRLNQLITANA